MPSLEPRGVFTVRLCLVVSGSIHISLGSPASPWVHLDKAPNYSQTGLDCGDGRALGGPWACWALPHVLARATFRLFLSAAFSQPPLAKVADKCTL